MSCVVGGGVLKGHAGIVVNRPQLLPAMGILIRGPRFVEKEIFFIFSRFEILKSMEPFWFAIVLKF